MLVRYEACYWIDAASLKQDGISGVWTPRVLADSALVLTYLLPLNRLSTSTACMLVVNLKESHIAQYMDASNQKDSSYYLIDLKEQSIISHNDKSALLTDVTQIPIISEMIKTGAAQGYQFNEVDGKRLLYTWNTSNLNDWLYIHSYSMDTLMSQTRSVQHGMIIFSIVIFLVGSVL